MANNAPPVPILLTRTRNASERFLRDLPASVHGRVSPVFSPLIDIVALNTPVDMGAQDGAIFTSANGVRHAPPGDARPAICVGTTTTDTALRHGWDARMGGENADALVAYLIADPPPHPLVHLSGLHTRGQIADRLHHAGIQVRHIAIYDQRMLPLSDAARTLIAQEMRVVVPLFSPRTAAHFATQVKNGATCDVLALSGAVADAVRHIPLQRLTISNAPTALFMGVALGQLI